MLQDVGGGEQNLNMKMEVLIKNMDVSEVMDMPLEKSIQNVWMKQERFLKSTIILKLNSTN